MKTDDWEENLKLHSFDEPGINEPVIRLSVVKNIIRNLIAKEKKGLLEKLFNDAIETESKTLNIRAFVHYAQEELQSLKSKLEFTPTEEGDK